MEMLLLISTFLIMATLPTIAVGFICGLLMPGLSSQQGLRRGIVVGLVTFALSVGLFFIQGGWLIYAAIALGMFATGELCYRASRNGSD